MLPVSSDRSENTRHTSPPVIAGRSLPKRAVSASTAWFGGATLWDGAGRRHGDDGGRLG